MQANDRQEQKVARRTYIAYALLTGCIVNITWLVDVCFRLLCFVNHNVLYPLHRLTPNKGNISKTAEFIGMERSALHRKLKSLGIIGIN